MSSLKASPSRRLSARSSSPSIVWKIWSAIVGLQKEKKPSSRSAIKKALETVFKIKPQVTDTELANAINDNLLVLSEGFGVRCPEDVVTSYDVPAHDWYCFACHGSGHVLPCGDCWRVYHERCWGGEGDICAYCLPMSEHSRAAIQGEALTDEDIKQVLSYVFEDLKRQDAGVLMKLLVQGEKDRVVEGVIENEMYLKAFNSRTTYNSLTCRLIAYHISFGEIDECIRNKHYHQLKEFVDDIERVVHNVCIIYGPNSSAFAKASSLYQFALNEINQVENCFDCYMNSRSRNARWFSIPCYPVHEVVLVKMKGSSDWPAKVIRRSEDNVLVTFFGDHEYGNISPAALFPVNSSRIHYRSKKLKDALEEYADYREVMRDNGVKLPSLENAKDDVVLCQNNRRSSGSRRMRTENRRSGASGSVSMDEVHNDSDGTTVEVPTEISIERNVFEPVARVGPPAGRIQVMREVRTSSRLRNMHRTRDNVHYFESEGTSPGFAVETTYTRRGANGVVEKENVKKENVGEKVRREVDCKQEKKCEALSSSSHSATMSAMTQIKDIKLRLNSEARLKLSQ